MATITKRHWTTGSGEAREAWVLAFTDANGKRHKHQHSTKRAADAHRVEVEGQVTKGTFRPDAKVKTVAAAVESYLDALQDSRDLEQVTEHYLRTTRAQLLNYVAPEQGRAVEFEKGIGSIRLAALTPPRVLQFRDDLRAAGVSVVTTRRILGSLSRALGHAIGKGWLAVNPAARIVVKGRRDEGSEKVTPPTKKALAAVWDEAGIDFADCIRFAAATGLRASELHALPWRNVDLEGKSVTVDRRIDAYGNLDVTKSKAGIRTVPMGAATVRRLKAWRARTKFSGADDLVFPAAGGGHVDHRNLSSRQWRPLLARAAKKAGRGFQPFGWHALRHFAISTWIEAGYPPKKVQTWAGHSALAVTMDRYGHLFPDAHDDGKMDAIADELFA